MSKEFALIRECSFGTLEVHSDKSNPSFENKYNPLFESKARRSFHWEA